MKTISIILIFLLGTIFLTEGRFIDNGEEKAPRKTTPSRNFSSNPTRNTTFFNPTGSTPTFSKHSSTTTKPTTTYFDPTGSTPFFSRGTSTTAKLQDILSLLKDASVDNSVSGTRKAFDFLDRNHDGKITANELKDIYISMNSTVDQTRIEKFMRLADLDGDNVVDYDEFLQYTTKYGKKPK